MLSEVLGLTIKKKVLNEDSSKKVVPAYKSLKKAAINYTQLSKAANDLNIVRQNIIKLVGLYGVQSAADKEDMHLLKDDEVEKKFAVDQKKEIAARTPPAEDDSKSSKGGKFKKIKEGAKKLATQVKNKAKDLFKSLMDNIKKIAKTLISKVKDFAKNAWKYLTELSDKIVGNKIKELEKKEATKIAKQAAKKVGKAAAKIAARTAAVATGPLGWVVLIIWTLWDGLTDAWDKWQETGDWYETLKAGIAGLIDSLTFGLFDKETAAKVIDGTVNFLKDIPKKLGEFISDAAKAIDDLVSGLVQKISEMNPLKPKPLTEAELAKMVADRDKQESAAEEKRKQNEELAVNLAKAQELIQQKIKERDALIDEIAALEVDAYGKKSEETEQITKKREELRKTDKALSQAIEKEKTLRKEASAPKPAPAPAPTKPTSEGPKGVVGVIITAMNELGISNKFTKIALLANIQKESNFVPVNENLNYTSVERIQKVFPSAVKKSGYGPKELEKFIKNPQALAEFVYGKSSPLGPSMGNKNDGDGYKYRGRGFIQITGKNNYDTFGKLIGENLVENPDKANDPYVAAKIAAAFVIKGLGKKLNTFTTQQEANRAVTQTIGGSRLNLNEGIGAEILAKVDKYSKGFENIDLGNASKEVSQGQREQMKPNDVNVINVAQTNNTKVNDTKVAAVDKKTNDNTTLLARAT
jgi:predicted chitinase